MNAHSPRLSMDNVLAVIMGGGQGTRLFPLTKDRSKPAVPLGGKYRLVDIPISNCLNNGIRRIYVLTQFNSASLHRHIQQTYKFDAFNNGFVEILAAEQTFDKNKGWYQGTADAVRQNMTHFDDHDFDYILILSGDQLYSMDLTDFVLEHVQSGAEISIATNAVKRDIVSGLGVLETDQHRRIRRFVEKPKDPAVIDTLRVSADVKKEHGLSAGDDWFLASMGIYIFNKSVLKEVLNNDKTDFGKHIIPDAIHGRNVHAYIYSGYWEDIGTIKSFFEASLDCVRPTPKFDFFDLTRPVFTHPRYLPPSRVENGRISQAVISDGCMIGDSELCNALVGIRSVIGSGCRLKEVVVMGADYMESAADREACRKKGIPAVGIGNNCHIEHAIIDKNARIGENVRISPEGKPAEVDGEFYFIRDGIVIIPKNAVVPSGTVI